MMKSLFFAHFHDPRRLCAFAAILIFITILLGLWLFANHETIQNGRQTRRDMNAHISDHSPLWECEKWSLEEDVSTQGAAMAASGGIVIMTPIFNAEKHLPQYFKNLCALSYPHHQISVVLGEDSSTDKTFALAQQYISRLSKYFRRIKLADLSQLSSHAPWSDPHQREIQLERRRHLAYSRNGLLMAGLQNEDWVLWLDVDVQEMPPDIIERLMAPNKDIIVPSCMYHRPITGYPSVYDRNSWRESNHSKQFLKDKPKHFLMLEGYDSDLRDHLHRLSKEGAVVELDGVGGCVLLIKADCHRKGLVFPPFVYNHHIETEGLAKLAKDMGFGVFGMPKLFVFHH